MKISKAHKKLAELLNNQRALDHPEEFLGHNWKNILNFWFYLDTLSPEQWRIVNDRYYELNVADRSAALEVARAAAYQDAARAAARDAADAARAAAYSAGWATLELMGSDKILEENKPLTFLPLFLNL